MTAKQFRPMLAPNKVVDPDDFHYPCWGSFKLDGMRLLVQDGGVAPDTVMLMTSETTLVPYNPEAGWTQPLTRSLKPVANLHARALLSTLPHGLDGELCTLAPDGSVDFRGTMSKLRSEDGKPEIRFFVFDNFAHPGLYDERYASLSSLTLPAWVEVLEQVLLNSPEEARAFFKKARLLKHEGVILRRIKGAYKHNRCTEKEQIMSKMKPKKDTEVVCFGITQGFTNTNEQTRNELGLAKRSSHKAGKVATDMLGAYVMMSPDWERPFEVGTGIDHDTKRADLANKPIAEVFTITFMDDDVYDVPRTASLKGRRALQDLDAETLARLAPLIAKAKELGCVVDARLYKPGKLLLTEPYPLKEPKDAAHAEMA